MAAWRCLAPESCFPSITRKRYALASVVQYRATIVAGTGESMDVYDQDGRAVGYIRDGYFLNWNGSPAAYIQNGAIYDLKKRHVGHVGDGWIRDRKGHAVAFFDEPSGGPMPPMKIRPPLKPVAPAPPLSPLLPIPPLAPIPTSQWSPFPLMDLLSL